MSTVYIKFFSYWEAYQLHMHNAMPFITSTPGLVHVCYHVYLIPRMLPTINEF